MSLGSDMETLVHSSSPTASNLKSWKRAFAIWIALATLNPWITVTFASARPEMEVATGRADITGVVTIDDAPAYSGQTIFSHTNIVSAYRSRSTISLVNNTRLTLDGESTLWLDFSRSSFSGSLQKGSLNGFVPSGISGDITTTDASITTDPAQTTWFSIQASPGNTVVAVTTGRVEIRSGNKSISIEAGESFSTAQPFPLSPSPQNASNKKRVWLVAGIGGAIAVLIWAITGHRDDKPPGGGCVIAPSGMTDVSAICP